jgi:hypothetical protein
MKKLACLLVVACLMSASVAVAKRTPPPTVAAVKSGDVEYRAPSNQMGCIEAWDVTKNELIWRRQIYVVKYRIGLERDVQDVFIRSMQAKDGKLLVTNERQSEYELDLESLEVTVVKGALVETQ